MQIVNRQEQVTDSAIHPYSARAKDHDAHHVPDVQRSTIVQSSGHKGEILRLCNEVDLPEASPQSYTLLQSILGMNSFFEKIQAAIHSKSLTRSSTINLNE